MQPMTEKYRPRTIAEFYGLGRPKTIMERFTADPYPSAWLFVGPSGLGKTTMGFAIAKSLTGDLHHIPAKECNLETVQKTCMDCHYVPWGGGWHTVVVDEADQMTRPAQIAFLSVLDGTDMPQKTVFIFTANATDKLETRFLSRCRVIEFETADLDIGAMLRVIWEKERQGRTDPDFDRIERKAAGNVRTALTELELELLMIPKPAPVMETRWFDAMNRELGWDAIEERLARDDFSGVRAVEVEVYA